MIKINLFVQIKAQTSGSCLIERKFNSPIARKFGGGKGHSGRAILREGEVAESIAGGCLKRGEAVHVVVAEGVVGLVGANN